MSSNAANIVVLLCTVFNVSYAAYLLVDIIKNRRKRKFAKTIILRPAEDDLLHRMIWKMLGDLYPEVNQGNWVLEKNPEDRWFTLGLKK